MDAGTQNRGLIMLVWVLTAIMIVGLIVGFAVIHA
jgi:hypothetical protein